MNWRTAEDYLGMLDDDSRRTLLAILTSSDRVRAAAIGRLILREDGTELAELVILLEEKEWARQWFVERLQA